VRAYDPLLQPRDGGVVLRSRHHRNGVVFGESDGDGEYRLATRVGEVRVAVRTSGGVHEASLTSVEPRHEPASDELVTGALAALGWRREELDPTIPPARAYGGAWHLVLAAGSAGRLAELDYDFEALRTLMAREGLTTLQLVWRERPDVFHARTRSRWVASSRIPPQVRLPQHSADTCGTRGSSKRQPRSTSVRAKRSAGRAGYGSTYRLRAASSSRARPFLSPRTNSPLRERQGDDVGEVDRKELIRAYKETRRPAGCLLCPQYGDRELSLG
jgi:hypothetical protein